MVQKRGPTKKNQIKGQEKREKGHKQTKKAYLQKSFIHGFMKSKKSLIGLKPFEAEFDAMLKNRDGRKTNVQKEMSALLRQKSVPDAIMPNNDFYTFINYAWMKNTKRNMLGRNEDYIVQYDEFRIVQNKVFYEVIDIVKETIRTQNTRVAKEIAKVYKAGAKLLSDTQARAHINKYVAFLDHCYNMEGANGAWYFLGTMNKNEMMSFGLPFVFNLVPDEKDSQVFRSYLYQPTLSLVDFNVYFDDGTNVAYKANYRARYRKYIKDMFDAVFGHGHGLNPQDVFDVEVEMMNATICEGEPDAEYMRFTATESINKYGFDWVRFSKAMGFKSPPFFIVNNVNYLKCGTTAFLDTWTTKKWRTYFIYIYLRQVVKFHKTWRTIPFEFCGKFMRAQKAIFPDELMPIYNLSFSFNTFLTNRYIEKNANEAAIQYIKTLAEDLRIVFRRIISRNRWLQPATKAAALQKLDHFHFEIGSPGELREDPLLDYTDDDVWENFLKILRWRAVDNVRLEGQKVIDIPTIDWTMEPFKIVGSQAYVVNAFYTPTKNGIYLPLAYIQKPFVDMEERGIEYNLATLGFTIGHEMSHSLDDLGSKYDYMGNMKDWWTDKDRSAFKRKQNDVIRHYQEYAKRDGIDFDAAMSVGEDLADISGLAICMEYLKDFQEKNKDIIPIRVLSFKAFLIYIAFQWKQIISKKAVISQIRTNPHPLDKYRCNVPLSRLEIFKDMYNVKPGDGMWWHNNDTIW